MKVKFSSNHPTLTVTCFLLTALWLCLAAVPAFSQETATIRIESGVYAGGKVYPRFQGPNAALANQVLRQDLEFDGQIPLSDSEADAMLFAQGTFQGAALNAQLVGANGQVIFEQSYLGPNARRNVHEFADAIVEKLTGRPGFATSRIAFAGSRTGARELYVCDYDGENIRQLTRDRSIVASPKFGPENRRILYSSYKTGYCNVYEADADSGAGRLVINWPGTSSGATYAPGGRLIALSSTKEGNPELFTTTGGSGRRLTVTPGTESSPTWGPEGNQLIFVSDTRNGRPQLYRMTLRGQGAQRLNTGYGYATEPDWSPDGSQVAFNIRAGGGMQIAILDLSTGRSRVVTSGAGAEDPSWAPNSRHLVYKQGTQLIVLDTFTNERKTIVSGFGNVYEPSWSGS
jgi:TolB protein